MKHELKLQQELIDALEKVAHLARTAEPAKTGEAIEIAKTFIKNLKGKSHHVPEASLSQLEQELSTWQAKLGVILKEPVGREGMAKHAHHWMEELRKC
ncbi:MAG: hypothetical protein ACREH5_02170 [Candidatus Omnitrophota bacterium]